MTEKDINKIVELQLLKVQERLNERRILLTINDTAKKYLVKKGYDPNYGARPLKRIIQSELLDELAMQLIEKKISDGDTVKVTADKNKLALAK